VYPILRPQKRCNTVYSRNTFFFRNISVNITYKLINHNKTPSTDFFYFLITTNKMQLFLIIYFQKALRASGGSFVHHQEHITVHSALVTVNREMEMQFHSIHWYRGWDGTDSVSSISWLTIPEAECTVMCSWRWAEEPPEICRNF
jgi:hypothetical protein